MSTVQNTRRNLASTKFYDQIKKHWDDKTPAQKKSNINSTLKKLNESGQVIAEDLTLKEQVQKVYEEITSRSKSWALNVWLKIFFGMKGGEKDLGTILTHDKFTDVRLVFSGANNVTYETVDNKLFHFEGKDQEENLVYIAKNDLKILSFSNYEHWPEKYKDKYRYVLDLTEVDQYLAKPKKKLVDSDEVTEDTHEDFTFLGGITIDTYESENFEATPASSEIKDSPEPQKEATPVPEPTPEPPSTPIEHFVIIERMEYTPPALEIEFEQVEILKEVIVEVEKIVEKPSKEPTPQESKKEEPKPEEPQRQAPFITSYTAPGVFQFAFPEKDNILNENERTHEHIRHHMDEISNSLDRLVYADFYEFKDPYIRNYWYSLSSKTKVALAKHAHNNNMSLEAATRMFKDVKYTF